MYHPHNLCMYVCIYLSIYLSIYIYIYIYTVKLASTTTSRKRPLGLNDRFKSLQCYSLYILP